MARKKGNSDDRLKKSAQGESQDSPIIEHSAGGMVFKQTPQGFQIAFIKDPYGKWAFAKGHIEKGESTEQAALRETKEEMGLRSLRIVARLGRINLVFEDRYRPATRGKMINKYVYYYLMQAAPGAFGKPQKTEKIRAMTWVPLERAMEKSGYEDVKPLIAKATKILRRLEKRREIRDRVRRQKAGGKSVRQPKKGSVRTPPKNN